MPKLTVKLPQLKLTKKLIIASVAVLFLILAVGGFFYYQEAAHQKQLAEIEANKLENKILKARQYREKNPFDNYYVKVSSHFYNRIQANVNDGKFRSYATAEIVLKVQNGSIQSSIKNVLPLIEHKANTLLGSLPASELKTPAGRSIIAQQLLLFANELLDPELTALYKKQLDPQSSSTDSNENQAGIDLEITVEDLPVQAVLFEAFMINR